MHFTFLPIVATAPEVAPAADPVAEFLRLLTTDPRQERPVLEVCPALQASALARATGLAFHGDPWAHHDANGVWANEYARRAGCKLPPDYSQNGNNIECLAAGSADPVVMFNALAGSPSHSDALFGRGWLRHQCHVGIAMVENEAAPYRWYWCIHLARCT